LLHYIYLKILLGASAAKKADKLFIIYIGQDPSDSMFKSRFLDHLCNSLGKLRIVIRSYFCII
ncbi:hypothetical protein, partial [uncultured Duncaniella sp.]|uniref:hypothetical protein n=1 Tax=uncultured Duncaniella sp. TaxID=2768039 RepID=UPI0026588452